MAEFINSWNFLSMNYLWNTFSLFRVPFLIFAPAPKNVWVGPAFVAKCDGTLFDFVFFVLFHFLFAESWLFGIFWMNELNLLNAWIFPWSLFGMVFVLDLLVYEAGDLTVLDFDLTYKSFYFCWLQWLNSMALTGCFLNCFGNGVLPSKVIKPHVLLMGKVNCEKK